MNIENKDFKATCKCQWYYKLFCSCAYKNKLAQNINKKPETFCNSQVDKSFKATKSLEKSENDLYLRRTLGPGEYFYAQPRIEICNSSVIGYNTDRGGLLPLSKKEVDIESNLRYSENIELNPEQHKECPGVLETLYTREIRPCNDISSISFNRFDSLLYNPQGHIAANRFQQGKDSKNDQSDAFFANYRKNF